MSSASLNKMTVPLASDQSNPTQGLLMPKLKYRFRAVLENFGAEAAGVLELTKQVIDITRPTVNFDEIEIPIYNSRMYLAGKAAWETVTINLRDDASNNVARLVGQQLQRQMDFLEQASAAAGIDYKFTTAFEVLDGGNGTNQPRILERWELYGCYLSSANYNDLNYASNEVATIALTLRFDNAVQTPINAGGFAALAGRAAGSVVTGTGTTV